MKKIIILLGVLLIPAIANANTYIEKQVGDHKFRVIDYDLSSQDYEIKIVQTPDETSLSNLMKANNGITGVNGAFFCPTYYSWCNTSKSFTTNEHYIEGEKYAEYLTTGDRAVFSWSKDKIPFIYKSGEINMDDEDKIYYGIGNYPLLLSDGKNMLESYWEKGLIAANMRTKGVRNFICSDKDKKHIYFGMVYNATIDELAGALYNFGCWDALNLDAGGSTAFMYNNRYLIGPNRDILDAVIIERKGLDVKEISTIGGQISNIIINDMTNKIKTNSGLILKTEKYIDKLNQVRIKGYDRFTTPIIEKNIVGENDEVGYKIEINDLKALKIILTINEVTGRLKNYKLRLEGKSVEIDDPDTNSTTNSHDYRF